MTKPDETIHTLPIGGIELQYADQGTGEPLLLVHGGVFADWFLPLATSAALEGLRIIRVRRAGYSRVPPSEPISLRDHARHLAALLASLHIEKVHVAGHSSGALISLEFHEGVSLVGPELGLDRTSTAGSFSGSGLRRIRPAVYWASHGGLCHRRCRGRDGALPTWRWWAALP